MYLVHQWRLYINFMARFIQFHLLSYWLGSGYSFKCIILEDLGQMNTRFLSFHIMRIKLNFLRRSYHSSIRLSIEVSLFQCLSQECSLWVGGTSASTPPNGNRTQRIPSSRLSGTCEDFYLAPRELCTREGFLRSLMCGQGCDVTARREVPLSSNSASCYTPEPSQ